MRRHEHAAHHQPRELNAQSLAYWRQSPIEFIETVFVQSGDRPAIRVATGRTGLPRRAFQLGDNGKLIYSEWVYRCPKKTGKTTFEAIIELTHDAAVRRRFPESYILANSLEQGKGRVFEICCRIVNASPLLEDEAHITAETIEFPAFNAVIQVIPSDAGSAAGTNAVVSGFDELWGYTRKRPPPVGRDDATADPQDRLSCHRDLCRF